MRPCVRADNFSVAVHSCRNETGRTFMCFRQPQTGQIWQILIHKSARDCGMFLYIAQPDCLYVVLLQRLKELALCNRILTLRKTVNEPDSPTTLRYVFKRPLRVANQRNEIAQLQGQVSKRLLTKLPDTKGSAPAPSAPLYGPEQNECPFFVPDG